MKTDSNKQPIAAAALTGVTLMVGGVEVADAGVITQTQNTPQVFSDSTGEGVAGLGFDLFDASLGTLQKVEISVANANYSIVADAYATPEAGTTTLSGDFVITFTNATGSPFANPWFSDSKSLTIDCSDQEDSGIVCDPLIGSMPSGTANQTQSYMADLDAFIGLGTFFTQFTIFNASLSGVNGPIFSEGTPFRWTNGTAPPGTMTVEYTYEEVRIPEPGTLALAGIGLAAFGATRKKKK